MKELGNRLKQLRKKNKMTQGELGQKLFTTNATISCWENDINNPDIAQLNALCDIFGVSADWILGRTEIETPVEALFTKEEEKKVLVIKTKEELTEEQKKQIDLFIDFVTNKK